MPGTSGYWMFRRWGCEAWAGQVKTQSSPNRPTFAPGSPPLSIVRNSRAVAPQEQLTGTRSVRCQLGQPPTFHPSWQARPRWNSTPWVVSVRRAHFFEGEHTGRVQVRVEAVLYREDVLGGVRAPSWVNRSTGMSDARSPASPKDRLRALASIAAEEDDTVVAGDELPSRLEADTAGAAADENGLHDAPGGVAPRGWRRSIETSWRSVSGSILGLLRSREQQEQTEEPEEDQVEHGQRHAVPACRDRQARQIT